MAFVFGAEGLGYAQYVSYHAGRRRETISQTREGALNEAEERQLQRVK